MSRVDGYILCATPRSGTTLLCDLLGQTGAAGRPNSFFRRPSQTSWMERFGLDPDMDRGTVAFSELFLTAALAEGRAGGDLFGMRLMQENLQDFLHCVAQVFPNAPDDPARIKAALGRVAYIHVVRRDVVAQAISLVKAQQSGLWHRAADGSELERLRAPADPQYDFAALHTEVCAYRRFHAAWDDWFARNQITPLTVVYEDLAADPIGQLGRITDQLGLPRSCLNGITPGVSKLSDATNRAWAARYRAEADQSFGPNQS